MRRSDLAAFFRANERPIIGAGSLALFLVLWEIISRSGVVDPLFISSPVRVVRTGIALLSSGEIWVDLKVSGVEFVRTRQAGGNRRMTLDQIAGSNFVIPCDMVVRALGQEPLIELLNKLS
jgi:hypothetical protein